MSELVDSAIPETTPAEPPVGTESHPSSLESTETANAAGGGPAMDLDIETNNANQTNIGNVINQFFAPPSDTVAFSAEMASPIEDDTEKELYELVTIDPACVEMLLHHLEQHRVLVLKGDQRTGKTTVAKYLATQLAKAHDLKFNTYVVEPLERRVRILLRKVASERTEFGSRVTIFSDAFEGRNKDLLTFFSADASAWAQLVTALRANDAYLIFTTAHVHFDGFRGRLSDHVVCFELPATPAELIPLAVDRKLAWLEAKGESRAERLQNVATNRDRLIEKLKTLPQVIGFINEYVRGDVDFHVALERHGTGSSSFLQDLAGDVDAWCFALTLALTQATVNTPVAWSDFEQLRRLITDRIKSDTEIFPSRRFRADANSDEPQERTTGASLTDDGLLDRCRAWITKDSAGLRDTVLFKDPSCASGIWDALLQHHRRALTAIVPLLRSVAEKERGAASISLRFLAAEIIGRIGAVDPTTITLPLIEREWISSGRFALRPLVGCLLRGVLASGNPRYHQTALRALEALAIAETGMLDEKTRDRFVTAIASYSRLGEHESARAMEHLGDIAIQHCAPFMAEVYEILMLAEKADREQSVTASKERAAALRARRRRLGARAHRTLAQQRPILVALEQALVYLCLMTDEVQTLTATRDWMSKGGPATGMLVTLLFLQQGGIADRLDDFAAEIEGNGGTATISPLILSAASSRESLRGLSSFLADIHSSVHTAFVMPADLQRKFQDRFAACLTGWARGALLSPVFRDVVAELFGALAAARGGAMRRELYTLVGTPAFADGEAMRSLATAIRKRIGA